MSFFNDNATQNRLLQYGFAEIAKIRDAWSQVPGVSDNFLIMIVVTLQADFRGLVLRSDNESIETAARDFFDKLNSSGPYKIYVSQLDLIKEHINLLSGDQESGEQSPTINSAIKMLRSFLAIGNEFAAKERSVNSNGCKQQPATVSVKVPSCKLITVNRRRPRSGRQPVMKVSRHRLLRIANAPDEPLSYPFRFQAFGGEHPDFAKAKEVWRSFLPKYEEALFELQKFYGNLDDDLNDFYNNFLQDLRKTSETLMSAKRKQKVHLSLLVYLQRINDACYELLSTVKECNLPAITDEIIQEYCFERAEAFVSDFKYWILQHSAQAEKCSDWGGYYKSYFDKVGIDLSEYLQGLVVVRLYAKYSHAICGESNGEERANIERVLEFFNDPVMKQKYLGDEPKSTWDGYICRFTELLTRIPPSQNCEEDCGSGACTL